MTMPQHPERWVAVEGFPNYEVSDLGRVRNARTGRVRTNSIKCGYMYVTLYNGGKSFSRLVHRLVAEAFVRNDNDMPCVNHKDEDPTNNAATNLEWCDCTYNTNYGSANERRSAASRRHHRTPVVCTNANGKVVRFRSIKEAARTMGVSDTRIRFVIYGKANGAAGYRFAIDVEGAK